MLLFPNATLYVSQLTITKDNEGNRIKTFDFNNPIETFQADVQPNTLTSVQIQLYGIDSKTADTKKCFIDIKDGRYMTLGNRVKVEYTDGRQTEYYHIQPTNIWRFHKEFLLIPVENE